MFRFEGLIDFPPMVDGARVLGKILDEDSVEHCPPCPVVHLYLPLHKHHQLKDGDSSSAFCFHSITYNRRKTAVLQPLDQQHKINQATKCKDAPSIIRAQLSPKGSSIDGGDRKTSKQVQRCTYSHNAQLSPIGFRRSPPSIELPKLYRWWGSFVALCGDWRPPPVRHLPRYEVLSTYAQEITNCSLVKLYRGKQGNK